MTGRGDQTWSCVAIRLNSGVCDAYQVIAASQRIKLRENAKTITKLMICNDETSSPTRTSFKIVDFLNTH